MKFHWKEQSKYVAEYHTDTVEFCSDGSMALCGSYELNSDTQERFGGLLLFSRVSTDYQYVLSSNISCSGVLDISWLNGNVAIGALANGSTKLWNCTIDGPSLNELIDFPVSDHILLSVDTSSDRFVFSDSGGNISVWKIDASSCSNPQSINKWPGHEFEAWCACLNKWNSEIVFTGSDDSKCCVWDLREGCKKPLNIIRHSVGVCSIQNYPDVDYSISTGSYDDTLYLWDLRMIHSSDKVTNTTTTPLQKCQFNGGVWRHKWGPQNYVIVSAIHDGFAVAHLSLRSPFNHKADEEDSVYKFRSTNGQLAYGIDWSFNHKINQLESNFMKSTVVCCSFYDNTIEFGELIIKL
ncbi:Diphthine methyltransferase [Schistosoma haematobium]|uniref:methylated diphthine methylhydrolase n=3 Tax=Schistosoma TaxID=6181 RepID=A0A094ZS17_SCHHA|nr:Diphthine methyltransferase [Schistosoma haematobium]KAH9587047.1 Diphthine methyltransferase [Schistosoma haematobium]CAH8538759.1 unnamed protein product [Schistosoma haematobium]CAH8542954.1 unnamed protein product [Schistosoma haematobium]